MWINDVARDCGFYPKTGTFKQIDGIAVFNSAGTERYILEKRWRNGGKVFLAFMMNPSSASESASDPTVNQMISLAQDNDCDALQVVNVSCIIDGKSKNLSAADFIMHQINKEFIEKSMEHASIVFISWGIKGQQGINNWLESGIEASEIFKKAKSKLHAYEVPTAVKEKIHYVPHPRPLGANINKYIHASAEKLSEQNYSKLFRGNRCE